MKLEDWKRVLVFGAHVDDEIIGPGGKTVAERNFNEHSVRWETEIPGDAPYYFATVYAADKTDGPTAYASPVWLR